MVKAVSGMLGWRDARRDHPDRGPGPLPGRGDTVGAGVLADRGPRLDPGTAGRPRAAAGRRTPGAAAAVVGAGAGARRGAGAGLVQGEPAPQRLRGPADRRAGPLGARARAHAAGGGRAARLVAAAGRRRPVPAGARAGDGRPRRLGGPAAPVRHPATDPDPVHPRPRTARGAHGPHPRPARRLRPAARLEHRPRPGRPRPADRRTAPPGGLVRRTRRRRRRGQPRPRRSARRAAVPAGARPVHVLRLGRRGRLPPVLQPAGHRRTGPRPPRARGAAPAARRLPGALDRHRAHAGRAAAGREPRLAAQLPGPRRLLGPYVPRPGPPRTGCPGKRRVAAGPAQRAAVLGRLATLRPKWPGRRGRRTPAV
ncbi:hypothetical protein SGPA1_21514 [Streptomyces misionensis JCM 4497]